jgi:hypothetical protein
MKTRILITVIGFLMFNLTFGQDKQTYSELIKEAWDLYNSKEYLKSGEKYAEALVGMKSTEKGRDRYNAACSWALANQIDASFVQLFKIAKNGNYTNLGHITTDSDLNVLHSDKRWEEVIRIVTKNKEIAEKDLDKPLVATLELIFKDDQSYRRKTGEIKEKYGRQSEEMKVHRKIINEKDSLNLIKIEKILNERGWLGTDIIGRQGNNTLFLVIQHSDLETQLKYLPMMREAVTEGNTRGSSLALLEDRVALRQGNRQIYGSKIYTDKNGEKYVAPLIEPENVDKRRAEVGLGPLANYAERFDFTWDVEKHKEKVKKMEAEKAKQRNLT